MNLEIGLKMINVDFTDAQTKMDLIKTKIDEVQSGALQGIKFDRVGMADMGEITFSVLFLDLTLAQSITTLTAVKNKISSIADLSVTAYKYI